MVELTFQTSIIIITSWIMSAIFSLLLADILIVKRRKGAGFRWSKRGNLTPNQKKNKIVFFRFIEVVLAGLLGIPLYFLFYHLIKITWHFYFPIVLIILPSIYIIIIKTMPHQPYKIKWYHWLISALIWAIGITIIILMLMKPT